MLGMCRYRAGQDGPTSPGRWPQADQYFRTTPRFETGDERNRWLTTSLFVAEGRHKEGGAVDYRVYRIT